MSSDAVNVSAIATSYSQLAGVLAGFAFAALVALIAAQLSAKNIATKASLEGYRPLVSAFLALVLASLTYAIVSGDQSNGTRAASLETGAGLGFSAAGIMLMYSIFTLIRGMEADFSNSQILHSTGNLVGNVIILVVAPLLTALLMEGVYDFEIAEHLPGRIHVLDVVGSCVFLFNIAFGVFALLQRSRRRCSYPQMMGPIAATAIILAVYSVISTSATEAFETPTSQEPDLLQIAEILALALFSSLVCWSTATYDPTAPLRSELTETVEEQSPREEPIELRSEAHSLRECSGQIDASLPGASGESPESSILIFEPMSTSSLVKRSLETFPAGYLTIISIVQGVALGLLIQQAIPAVLGSSVVLGVERGSEALFILVAIIVVSYEYLWFSTIMRWTPTARDTVIPLLLGVGEIVPSMLLDQTTTAYWLAIAIFLALGSIAYLNTISRLDVRLLDSESTVDATGLIARLLRTLFLACAAALLLSTSALIAILVRPAATAAITISVNIILVAIVAGGMISLSEVYLNRFYSTHGIERRPPNFWVWSLKKLTTLKLHETQLPRTGRKDNAANGPPESPSPTTRH